MKFLFFKRLLEKLKKEPYEKSKNKILTQKAQTVKWLVEIYFTHFWHKKHVNLSKWELSEKK